MINFYVINDIFFTYSLSCDEAIDLIVKTEKASYYSGCEKEREKETRSQKMTII